ncbi:hypothetical protein OIE66_07675 [Nonomuraea sp. NBC_01738]|uniref:hypothetical protein n=1 Tax=Nonomuraea sp. NBC_01738 TaxID=2976003 RepID=UPI002E0FB300|nr:hypothetical protein OIE66_07675 [Nonomuraea sp. NBC_01738]
MYTAWQILGLLFGLSIGIFLLISALVLLPGRGSAHRAAAGPVWLGGPSGSEQGVSTSGLVLADRPPRWATAPEVDWVQAAETAEPGRHIGGATAGW